MKKEKTVVAVSGGFDPLTIGHLRMFKEAKKLGDRLVVIINNDYWLSKKRSLQGLPARALMPDTDRKQLISAYSFVYRVIITSHKPNNNKSKLIDMSVCKELEELKPNIFANGGDKKEGKDIREYDLCKKLGIKTVFGVGSNIKIRSSSEFLQKWRMG